MWILFEPNDRFSYLPMYTELSSVDDEKYIYEIMDVVAKLVLSNPKESIVKNYKPLQKFSTLDYASAYERGCVIKTSSIGLKVVQEQQRDDFTDLNGWSYRYVKLTDFLFGYNHLLYFKDKTDPVIDQIKNKEFDNLKDKDGVSCRNCNTYIKYGIPDNIINDNKRTCYSCVQYLISVQKWPLNKRI